MARKLFISAIAALSLMAHTETRYNVALKIPHTRHIPDRCTIWVADSTGSHPVLVDKRIFEATKHDEYMRLCREGSAEADEE